MKFELEKADDNQHKWTAIFTDEEGRAKRVSFGHKSYEDYTQHRNRLRRSMYLMRHRKNENWNDPQTAGALSRWILWETPNLEINVRRFKQRFNLS